MEKVVFSEREKLFLVQLVSDENYIIENKKTDATTSREKNEAWIRITDIYNSQGFTMRSTKQLKKCWENIKHRKRKLKRLEQLTGDVPLQNRIYDPVMDFVEVAVPNIEGNCTWDSTGVYEEKVGNLSKEENIGVQCELKTPKTPKVNILNSIKKRKFSSIAKNKYERCLRVMKLKESISQQRELHAEKMKTAQLEKLLATLKVKEQLKHLNIDVEDIDTFDVSKIK